MSRELPRGWTETSLSSVVYFQEGPGLRKWQFGESGIPFLNIRTFENGQINRSKCQFVKTEEFKGKYEHFLLNDGDLVVSSSGTLGKVATVRSEDLPLMLNTSTIRFRARYPEALTQEFLRFYVQSDHFFRQIDSAKTGSAILNYGPSHLKKMNIVLAPHAEQRRIVAKVEKLLGKVDACQQGLARIPVLLKRFRQSVLAAACSGRLTADWREENPNLATNVELSPTAGSENEWPPGWRVASLNEVAEKVQDGNYGALYPKADEWIDSGVAFLIPAAIAADGKVNLDKVRFISPKRNTDLKKAQLADGDVIFPNRGSRDAQRYGFEPFAISIPKTLLPANINPQLTLVRPRAEVLMSGFLHLALNAEFFLSQVREATGGSALAFINLTETKRLRIPIPPLPEQQQIVRRVEALFALADQIEAHYAKAKVYVGKLTPSLLAKAFRGELVPQDPNDEPAQKLLQRIKSLKEAKR
jgi:type I restriction enzyme, S subunit